MDFVDNEYLLQKNQEKSPENIALFNAAMVGSKAGVESALQKGGKPNYFHNPQEQKNSLHISCENGYHEIVKLLIEHGAVLEALSGVSQATPMVFAAQSGSPETVQVLVDAGARVNAANCYGNTPLHEAAHDGNGDIVDILLKAGADVNAKNHKGSCPLSFMCYSENAETHPVSVAKKLLDARANASSTDEEGMTPLLVACASGRSDLISLLMDYGACPTVRDNSGRSATDIANFHGHPELMVRFGPDSPMKRFGDRTLN